MVSTSCTCRARARARARARYCNHVERNCKCIIQVCDCTHASVLYTYFPCIYYVHVRTCALSDFCEDGGQMRGANSQCEPPSGDSEVKDTLVIASFVFSLLVLAEWSVSAALWRYTHGVDTNKNKYICLV